MNFSGIYMQETFYHSLMDVNDQWIHLQDLSGCNCYCDDDAKAEIQKRIEKISPYGIHFIDSGNYHYMSRIWLEKINQPFRLLVFDNHTDMQPPAFGGILSCGGWIAASVEELPNLKEVILVGPDEEDYVQVDAYVRDKTRFLSKMDLKQKSENERNYFFENIPTDLPLYISVDKDVLCKDDASTTWSQGDMSLDALLRFLKILKVQFEEKQQIILGIDICGECDIDKMFENEKNDKANKELLKILISVSSDDNVF